MKVVRYDRNFTFRIEESEKSIELEIIKNGRELQAVIVHPAHFGDEYMLSEARWIVESQLLGRFQPAPWQNKDLVTRARISE
jgi:hypothetical protein